MSLFFELTRLVSVFFLCFVFAKQVTCSLKPVSSMHKASFRCVCDFLRERFLVAYEYCVAPNHHIFEFKSWRYFHFYQNAVLRNMCGFSVGGASRPRTASHSR